MKKILSVWISACLSAGAMAQSALAFDANAGVKSKMTVYDGTEVGYTAYERLFYVTNVEDSTYQFLNVYVPDGATQQTPIFLRTYVGGYMASPAAQPQAGDAERIITDGTSAGGAMSALMGATGNNPEYAELLKAMGAADERDDVFASVCYCPIIDLEHADMAYEWLYGQTDSRQSLDDAHMQMTKELAALFPVYVNSLNLKKPDGTPLTADNYLDYLKSEIIRSAQIAKNAGADIPDSIGFSFTSEAGGMFAAPINGGMRPQMQGEKRPMMQGGQPPMGMRPMRGGMGRKQVGEYITDLDMQKYLNYVVSTQALKSVPAFDSQIEGVNNASGENEEFGNETGGSVNFTDYTAQKNNAILTDAIRQNVRLMNPMSFIGDGKTTIAPHWYIRHGARDRDTAFPVPLNFATKLQNAGKDVNFLLAWNRPHSGDYALDELFEWMNKITK